MTSINRRGFLKNTALLSGSAIFPNLLFGAQSSLRANPTPGFHADVEIQFTAEMAALPIKAAGAKTHVFHYQGKLLKGPKNTLQHLANNYLGPVMHLQKGQKVRIFFYNKLNEPSIMHWHGLHVPQKSDGHPMYAIQPGDRYVYEFEVLNRAGSSFYHAHTHGKTATQVYKGLAGLITVSDSQERALNLPAGEYDLPLVLQDRSFDRQNQLSYLHGMHTRMLGFLGEEIIVNGKSGTQFHVKSRAYRFRTLNGSNSRIYKLAWDDGTPLTAIGTDAGLLAKPEQRPYIMLSPGERIDLWLDFSGRSVGSQLVLRSLPYQGAMPFMYDRMGGGMMGGRRGGGMMGGGQRGGMGMMAHGIRQGSDFAIATFKVTEKVSDSPKLPDTLAPIQILSEQQVHNADHPIPIGLSMRPMSPQLNGKTFSMYRVMDYEKVALNSLQKIRIFHEGHSASGMRGGMGMMMSMAHPIHLHGQQYQILSRDSSGMSSVAYDTVKHGFIDSGWKDTVLVMPGQTVEIIKPFQDYKGLFLYHCHNLEHEDLGMMRQFYVG